KQDALKLSLNRRTDPIPELSPDSSIKRQVKKWYDEFGWKLTDGLYGDTAFFSQVGRSGHGFYEMISHLSFLDRFQAGEFFLDAASGALAHPEYLAYSWCHKYRVCVDISLVALQEAASKIGEKGFCCMADICRLPFRENAFDGIVSGYTIQHVPEPEQKQTVAELYRFLAPNKYCCIMTDTGRSVARSLLFRALKMLTKSAFNEPNADRNSSISPPAELYFVPHNTAWWRSTVRELDGTSSVEALRIFEKREFEVLFGHSIKAAKKLRALEAIMPRLLAGISKYCLVSFSKSRPRSS
ncbi:MAG: class I SAM-dependent methyltransferase, partial [Terriglobia bacterium]